MITNQERSTIVVVGNLAAPHQIPEVATQCTENGREWPEAEAALEQEIKASVPTLILRRSHAARAWDATSVVTIDEMIHRTMAPLAVNYVGDSGGYLVVLANEDRWYCIAIETSGSTTFLRLQRMEAVYAPSLQPSP